jgi:hypothetical protein
MTSTDPGEAAAENEFRVGQPMNVVVTKDSKAGKAYEKARGLPRGGQALAPGVPPTPAEDLVFHGGKTIHDLHFVNYYLGGQDSWNTQENETDSIDNAISTAMSDKQLNNVMTQYFDDDNITSVFERSEFLKVDIPTSVFKDDAQKIMTDLHSEGKFDDFDLDSTVFNLILPRNTILFSDFSGQGNAKKRAQGGSKNKDDGKEAEDIPFFPESEADSLNGLGGYHDSVHVGNGSNRQTIYYSINAYSGRMDDGRKNGISVFDKAWKNIVFVLYHELNEARTDPDVGDVINGGGLHLLGWNSRRGQECGDFPIEQAFGSGNIKAIIKEVTIGGMLVPIQLQYSNFVHGPEGPIPNPHPRVMH